MGKAMDRAVNDAFRLLRKRVRAFARRHTIAIRPRLAAVHSSLNAQKPPAMPSGTSNATGRKITAKRSVTSAEWRTSGSSKRRRQFSSPMNFVATSSRSNRAASRGR